VRVDVHLFATFRAFSTQDIVPLDLAAGSTVEDAARALAIPPELARVTLVNGQDVPPDHRLCEGDVVSLFPPLAGGTPRDRDHSRRASAVAAASISESISAPTSNATPLA
jgi:molybdopterin converting factor small subunit